VEIVNATRSCRMRIRKRMSPALPAILNILALLLWPMPLSAQEGFSAANAYNTVRFLADEVGPRPMGSPAEQRALAYAVSTFASCGCDTAYLMPMRAPDGINTTSGVAVGILRGATERIIVIGGHIDSSSPEVPGANDDASGAACVMELARVLGKRDLQSTVVFACFGGEEEGLLGSKHFVTHFPLIDSVALMLQIDMVDGASYLELDPDSPEQVSAPRWLTEAAMEEYYTTLGFENLRYLTNASTLNSSTPGGTGSDHHSFLAKGIPALCLSSDAGYPIHTPLDNVATFDSSGLVRSGNLVLRLVERFDGVVPSRSTEKYYLLQFGKHPLFITHPVLLVFVGLSVGLAVVAFLVLRRRRLRDRTGQPHWSGAKLALFALIVQAFVWLPETLVGMLKGLNYPWVNTFPLYSVLSGLTALVGIWVVIRLASRWGLQSDPFPYFVRVFILMVGGVFGAVLLNPEIGLYAAWPLFWLSLAIFLRPAWMKAVAFLVAAYLPLRLVFIEPLTFLQRGFSSAVIKGFWSAALTDLLYVAGFMFLSLPFVYGLAALYRESGRDLFFLKRFRSARAVALPSVVALALGGYLLTVPDYDGFWQKSVRIEQRYVMGEDSSTVRITGSEGVEDVSLEMPGGEDAIGRTDDTISGGEEKLASSDAFVRSDDTVGDDRGAMRGGRAAMAGATNGTTIGTTAFSASYPPPSPADWLSYEQTTAVRPDSSRPDSLVRLDRVIDLYSPVHPLSVTVRYHSELPVTATSPWAFGSRRRSVKADGKSSMLTWYAYPEMPLRIPVQLRVRRGQSVMESVEATYDTLAAPLRASAPLTLFRYRTTIVRNDTLRAPGGE